MKHILSIWLLMLLLAGWVTPAQAFTLGDVRIHGFGGWAYGKTDNANEYLGANKDGSYDYLNLSLNISASPAERLTVHIQTGYATRSSDDDVGLDYGFAEWFFFDALTVRVGKVKVPFMLYTETYDVGTIRPLFHLPQGVYQQLAAEAYNGVGLTGSIYPKDEWEISYDLYGGKLSLLPNQFVIMQGQQLSFQEYQPVFEHIVGGRLALHPPIEGLNVGFSTYGGETEGNSTGDEESLQDTYLFLGTSLEYLTEKLWFRSEYLVQRESEKIEIDVVYAELAWYLTERWQVATRYERTDFAIPTLPPIFPDSLFDHQEFVVGLNYWFNPNFVCKLSYHRVQGNQFAYPGNIHDYAMSLQRGYFEEETHLILIGTQFSF